MSDVTIQCPQCNERFLVSPDLVGETMQCGSCDTQFELTSDFLKQKSKPKPLRHKPRAADKGLDSFTRCTPRIEQDEEASARAVAYQHQVDVTQVMPLGAARLTAIGAGGAISIVVILLFVLGGGEEGILKDLTGENRWLIVLFSTLVASLLLLFGFRKYRAVGVSFTVVLAVAQLSLPLVFPVPSQLVSVGDSAALSDAQLNEQQQLKTYKEEIGYASVERKMEENPRERVVCIALKGVKLMHIETIKSYLSQSLDSEEYPSEYKGRTIAGVPTILLVYTEVDMPIERFARFMQRFASDTKIRKDLRIIEVAVDSRTLTQRDSAELNDASKPTYYKANLEELQSIDRSRQLAAILRLGLCKKLTRRADIENLLLELLQQKKYPHRAEIINTLITWAGDDGRAEAVIKAQAAELMAARKEIPQSTIDFCVQRRTSQIGDILLYIWKRDPVVHENTLVLAGERAEQALLPVLPQLEPLYLASACNVLRKIGSENSLPTLLALHESATDTQKKSLKAAIDEIESRR